MSETILKCENLCKHFGKKQILDRVSLEVKQGDILGFIGPNGAGKTTTIKLILGLQSIDSGTVKINGYDIQKDFEKAIEKVGTIVENPDLYMYLSGYDNLKLIANLYKNVDKKSIGQIIRALNILSIFNLIQYDMYGGENPEIFIRLNDPAKRQSIKIFIRNETKIRNSSSIIT